MTEDQMPWRPFVRLVNTIRLVPFDAELRDRFDLGRAHLVGLAMIFAQLTGQSVKQADLQVREAARPRGHLVRRLQRN